MPVQILQFIDKDGDPLSTTSSTSSESTTAPTVPLESSLARDAVAARVSDMIDRSEDRSQFLRALATELQSVFESGLVAIATSHWANPMMLVADNRLSQQVKRSAILDLLESATRSPIACTVTRIDQPPNVASTDPKGTDPKVTDPKVTDPQVSGQTSTVRGLRIELTSSPDRSALLLIYPADRLPRPVDQVTDLRRLSHYADSARTMIETLPITESIRSMTETQPSSNSSTSTQLSAGDGRSLQSFHHNLDLDATGYRIANESRRILNCDRATVLIPRRGKFKVASVSGVAVVDRRSNSVPAIERLTDAAVVMSRPLILPSHQPLPPQIQLPLDHYLDESGVMSSVMLPLHGPETKQDSRFPDVDQDQTLEVDPFGSDGELVGVLILEYFDGEGPSSVRPLMKTVASEATLALQNSLEHRNVFGLRLRKSVGTLTSKSRTPIASAVGLLIAGLMAAATLVQVDHHVIATGKIEPSIRRDVFASTDGIVKELTVTDGQSVKAGDPIARIENAELEGQLESLEGKILTATKRLSSIAAMRLSESGDVSASSRLAMEERQLESELASYRAQQEIMRSQEKQLLITSPIDGTVVGWQMERRLIDRPVSRGNLLISIVDPDSDWSLTLNVPDDDAGPVLQCSKQSPDLPIEFAVATMPSSTFQATLESISTAGRLDASGQHVIDATAMVDMHSVTVDDRDDRFNMRSGADVTAKIACGRRSVLRSWFSDVFDFVHRNVLFYF